MSEPVPPSPPPVRRPAPALLLAIVPVAAFAAAAALLGAKGPYWLGFNSDPDYVYLLNAVNVARGLPPSHTDHPGTLVQALAAAVVAVVHRVGGEGDLASDVVHRAELHLRAIQWVLLAFYACALFVLGRITLASSRRLDAAMLAQASPFLSSVVLPHVACVKPEPILATIAALVAAAAVATTGEVERRRSSGLAVAMGVLSGATLATKANGLPLLLVPLIVLRGWRSLAVFALATAAAAAAFTVPAWPVLGNFFSFLGRSYGNGPTGHVDLPRYPTVFVSLLVSEPVMLAALLAGACVVLWDRRAGGASTSPSRRAIVALMASQLACVLLVAKHPSDQLLAPGHHYLIPALGLTGTVVALSWTLLAPRLAISRRAVLVTSIGAAAGLAIARAAAFRSVYEHLDDRRQAQLEAAAFTTSHYRAGNVLYHYRSSHPSFALHYGDVFAGWRYGRYIAEVYPASMYYNVFTGYVELYRPTNAPAEIMVQLDPGPVAMQGSPLALQQALSVPLGMPFQVGGDDLEAVYEVREHQQEARAAVSW